tara:strand:- start:460 stop:1245 length:786 start_codon:yes stop_codon:yes gene_type:complete
MLEHFRKFDKGGKSLLPLSFSHLNEFAFQRERWALKRLFDYEFPTSAPMERGKAVESGLYMWLSGVDYEEVVAKMFAEYDGYCVLLDDIKVQEERKNLVPLLDEGIKRFKDHAFQWNLLDFQKKVELDILGVPFVGYTDFHFEDKKTKQDFFIDLKTTLRKPNGISNSHAMQQSIYQRGTNAEQKLWYLVSKKSGTEFYEFGLADYKRPMRICEHIIIVMTNFLEKVNDLDDLRNALIPNPDDWIWKEKAVYEARKKVWGY